MENWLKSLSIRELKTWIKNNDALRFFASDLQIENIELAKEILKDKIDLAIMLDQEDRKLLEDHEIWLDMVNKKG